MPTWMIMNELLTNYETANRYLDDNAEFLRDAAFFFRNAGRRVEASTAAKSLSHASSDRL